MPLQGMYKTLALLVMHFQACFWAPNRRRGYVHKPDERTVCTFYSSLQCTISYPRASHLNNLLSNKAGRKGWNIQLSFYQAGEKHSPRKNTNRREEGAVKRLRGRGCFTVAAATAPALLGQVWFAIYVNRGLHSMSVRSLNLSLADSLDLHSPLLCSSFLAARGQTSCPTSSMGETSMCYAHC